LIPSEMLGRQASDYKTALINRKNQTDWTNTLGIIWEKGLQVMSGLYLYITSVLE
jgi:hypothetical protein